MRCAQYRLLELLSTTRYGFPTNQIRTSPVIGHPAIMPTFLGVVTTLQPESGRRRGWLQKSGNKFSIISRLGLVKSPVLWHKRVAPYASNLTKRLEEVAVLTRLFFAALVAKFWANLDVVRSATSQFAKQNCSLIIERRSAATLECSGSTPLWLQSPGTSRHDLASPPMLRQRAPNCNGNRQLGQSSPPAA
jgi:hypothetical protein